MKNNIYTGIWLILAVSSFLFFSSCSKEDAPGDGQPRKPFANIKFNLAATRATAGDPADSNIASLRVLIYESGGDLKFNNSFSEIPTNGNTAVLEIPAGTYDFVFIANENSDEALKEQLSAADDSDFDNIIKLATLSFARSAFDAGKDIPMTALFQGVEVTPDNTVIVPGMDPVTGVWNVDIERLAVRLRLTITTSEKQFEKWVRPQSIVISGIPDKAYLYPGYDNGESRIVPGETFAASATLDTAPGFISETDADGNITVTYDRLILPELYLSLLHNIPANGLTVSIDFGDNVKSGLISAPPLQGYGSRLPRNLFLDMKITIQQDFLDIIGSILAWEDAPLGNKNLGDPYGQHTLTVDKTEYFFNAHGGSQSVDITTDHPDGWTIASDAISWEGYTLPTTVDNNFTTPEYTTGTAPRTGTFVVRAGNMTKTIRVTQFPPTATLVQEVIPDFTPGAFWKVDQTGERLIDIASVPDTGDWTAIVAEGEEWIHLDTRASTATDMTDVDDPGFDESHIVAGNLKNVGGTVGPGSPDIYFRIGLNSRYTPTTDAPARYGAVLLSYANHTKMQLISIRQGNDE